MRPIPWLFITVGLLIMAAGTAHARIPATRKVLLNLRHPQVIGRLHVYGSGVSIKYTAKPLFVHSGGGAIEVIANEAKNRHPLGGVRPAIVVPLIKARNMRHYREITLWVYVPESAAAHFFGRYDVRLSVNNGSPYWSMAAVSPGWNHVVWNFARHPQNAIAGSGSGATRRLPVMRSLVINLGPLMSGYGLSKVYISDIRMVPMRRLVSTTREELESVLGDDDSWSRRFQAVERLRAIGGLRVLPALIQATEDHVPLIRGEARRAMLAVVEAVGSRAKSDLTDTLHIGTPRMQLAVVHLLTKLGPTHLGKWVLPALKHALLSNDFYVRQAARHGLGTLGFHRPEQAKYLIAKLRLKATQMAAIRCLAEIGPGGIDAIPAELHILRDTHNQLSYRLWALRAVWWTEQRYLKPSDWVLALHPHSNLVYRHLTDLAMLRLEAAGRAGAKQLADTLMHSHDVVVQARAAEALGHIRVRYLAVAEHALGVATHNPASYVAWQARYDLHRINPAAYRLSLAGAKHAHAGPVRVTRRGNLVIVSNGIVQMTFRKTSIDPGPVSVQLDHGPNLVHSRWVHHILAFRKSKATDMFERQWMQKLGGCPINKNFQQHVTVHRPGEVQYVYTFPAGGAAPLQWQEIYVLRRGDHGFYIYYRLKNMTGKAMPNSIYPGNIQSIALEFNMLIAVTRRLFTTKMLNDNLRGPTSFGFPRQNYLQYPDIYQATWRLPNGEVDAKHEWNNYEQMSHVLGLAGPKYGFWVIFPSYSFLDGTEPTLEMNGFVGPLFIVSMDKKYYVPTAEYVGAHFEKTYGPMFIYLHRAPNTDANWIAAKREALIQQAQWPCKWVRNKAYHQRGAVSGRVKISTGQSAKHTWVILARPPKQVPADLYGDWLRNINPYMYWTQASARGLYSIKHIEPGRYDLFVWKSGVLGEARKNGIVIGNHQTVALGTTELTPLSYGKTVWQIGEPNRTVTEFRNGGNFHIWENYLRYGMDFPHGVNYTIGKSTASRDWNYLQPAIVQGHRNPTTWNIRFHLKKIPAGHPVLSVICGGRFAWLNVFANGRLIGHIHTSIGLQFVRTAPYGELIIKNIRFPRDLLEKGNNVISLSFASHLPGSAIKGIYRATLKSHNVARKVRANWTSFMAYSLIRLSMDKTKSLQPLSGRP